MIEVVKRIKLDNDQYEELKKRSTYGTTQIKLLRNLLDEYAVKINEMQEEFWNDIAKGFGFKNRMDCEDQGMVMKLNWAEKEVILYKE